MSFRAKALVLGFLAVGHDGNSARAELLLDVHLGLSFTDSARLTFKDRDPDPTIRAVDHTSFDTTLSLGARFGAYFDSVPFFGMAGEISYFEAEGGRIDKNRIIPLSVLVLFRAPLFTSDEHPNGRLQPYLGFGPTIFFQDVKFEKFGGVTDDLNSFSVDFGSSAVAGVTYKMTSRLGVFLEYRASYFEQRVSDREGQLIKFSNAHRKAEVDLFTQQVAVGLSFRF